MAYAPLRKGEPGQLLIDPEASISALQHEYNHFLEAKANGYPSAAESYLNWKERIEEEWRCYSIEIEFAEKMDLRDVENYCNEEIITKIASFSNLLEGYKFVGPWQYGHIAIAALYLLQYNRARDKYVEIYECLSDDDKFLVDNFIETEAYKL